MMGRNARPYCADGAAADHAPAGHGEDELTTLWVGSLAAGTTDADTQESFGQYGGGVGRRGHPPTSPGRTPRVRPDGHTEGGGARALQVPHTRRDC